jgi:hypothetical protein
LGIFGVWDWETLPGTTSRLSGDVASQGVKHYGSTSFVGKVLSIPLTTSLNPLTASLNPLSNGSISFVGKVLSDLDTIWQLFRVLGIHAVAGVEARPCV